jgi:Domain of unknown function (DUF5122) beta-propeller
MRRRVAGTLAAGIAGAAFAAAGLAPASAAVWQPGPVSQSPVSWTPNLFGGTVRGLAIVGSEVVAGGSFTSACQEGPKADGYCKPGTKVTRDYIVAFALNTGVISAAFHPALDGQIYQLAAGPSGTVYAGGAFVHVNGKYHRGIVQLNVSNGAVVSGFKATLNNGYARTIAVHGNELYVGGQFTSVSGVARTDVARLNAATGAVDPKFHFTITDPLPSAMDPVKLMYLAVSPDGTHVVFDGPFGRVNGVSRPRLAMVTTAGTYGSAATLANWMAPILSINCPIDVYTRGLDFSPDGKYFVIGSTGGPTWPNNQPNLCDAMAQFSASATGKVPPMWINWTGGDSIYVVADTGTVVYEGGHNRWLNNWHGHDTPVGGCFSNPRCPPLWLSGIVGNSATGGIGAVSPATGNAITTWTPAKTRGHGTELLMAYSGGLFVGSDGNIIHGQYRSEIAMLPK